MHTETLTNDEQISRELEEHSYFRAGNGRVKRKRNTLSSARLSRTLYRNSVRDGNYVKVGGNTLMVPTGEEIIIRVDRFRDEAQCKVCRGKGHTEEMCPECGGAAVLYVDSRGKRDKRVLADKSGLECVPCETCRCSSFEQPIPRSAGRVPCKGCRGTGQAVSSGGIAIAEKFTPEPTTGVILAAGRECKRFTIGDRVLFDQFAGKEFEYDKRKYRVMRETYPIALLIGDDDLKIGAAMNFDTSGGLAL